LCGFFLREAGERHRTRMRVYARARDAKEIWIGRNVSAIYTMLCVVRI
jgi:hypothetical protein